MTADGWAKVALRLETEMLEARESGEHARADLIERKLVAVRAAASPRPSVRPGLYDVFDGSWGSPSKGGLVR